MSVHIVDDPIGDPRWADLVDRHSAASIFHAPGWLNALRQTYGYEPFAMTTSSGRVLENGIVACRVRGWASRRLVSLPFSDHCDPLVDDAGDMSAMLDAVGTQARTSGWRSVELRPLHNSQPLQAAAHACGLERGAEYVFQKVDLRPELPDIFQRMHPSSTQRAIRRAEREGLSYESGASDRLLASFYRLLRMARRRHGLPPQPLAWFRNLMSYLPGAIAIHVASKDGQPVASILTLSAKKTIFYKYGGSDAAHHRLGGMPFLFWRVIQDARARGFEQMDLGRTDIDQSGLRTFKAHLGATQSALTYYRYPAPPRDSAGHEWMSRAARELCAHLPDAALDLAGRLIYKRLG